MSSIDLSKLKASLEKTGILIVEYYLLEEKCAMLKAYVYSINQFLLIYIPTKLRAELKGKKNMYELKSLEDVVDEEDYAKFDEYQINMIRQGGGSDKDAYKNLSQKYNKQIVLNGDGVEQFEKRIMRQVKRLNIPFSKLEYTIGVQNKKIMALHFGEEINLFYVKNYTKDVRCYMYIVNVKDLIENGTEMQNEIGSINAQFFKIICDIIDSNLTEIASISNKDYTTIIAKYQKQKADFAKKSDTFLAFIKKIDEEEKAEIKKYKGLFANETSGIRKNSLETEYQNVLSSFMKKRVDKTESMIEQTYVFHIFFLLLEEISFDNFIMIKRTTSNFEKLKALFD
jgi:hypothetical protein